MLPLPKPPLTSDGRVDWPPGLMLIYALCALPQKAWDDLKRRQPRAAGNSKGPRFPAGTYAARKEAELQAKIKRAKNARP